MNNIGYFAYNKCTTGRGKSSYKIQEEILLGGKKCLILVSETLRTAVIWYIKNQD